MRNELAKFLNMKDEIENSILDNKDVIDDKGKEGWLVQLKYY